MCGYMEAWLRAPFMQAALGELEKGCRKGQERERERERRTVGWNANCLPKECFCVQGHKHQHKKQQNRAHADLLSYSAGRTGFCLQLACFLRFLRSHHILLDYPELAYRHPHPACL